VEDVHITNNLLDVQATLPPHATPTSTSAVHVPNFKLYVFAVYQILVTPCQSELVLFTNSK